MVSSAIAVLPVWRSPMISSRWPRPIGISESIALRPVAIGSCTDLRGMMPGAFTSTRARFSALIGPFPSMGFPSASTTRPSRPLPTGTSTIARVRLTVWPSLISRSAPKITIPTLSVSRLSAMPRTPFSNSTISPACTLSRPSTRAMPGVLVSEVEALAAHAVLELDHLAGLHIVEAVDARDAVADRQHLPDFRDFRFGAKILDLALQNGGNFGGLDVHVVRPFRPRQKSEIGSQKSEAL